MQKIFEIYKELVTEDFSLSIIEIRTFVSLDTWRLDEHRLRNEESSWDSLVITSNSDIKVAFFFAPEK